MAEFNGYRKKKKVCQLCAGHHITYKDEAIKKYVSNEKSRILPRRVTGNCAEHQRYIAGEVKKARFMALIPFTN